MENKNLPSKAGQICKLLCRPDSEKEYEVYIIVDDPSLLNDDAYITVVPLGELQRNVHQPDMAKRLKFAKNNLSVLGENLTEYIESWNNEEK